jgi:hypothetical protein
MPLAEAGFQTPDGRSDSNSLILFGPTIPAYIGHHPSTDLISPATEQVSALVDSGAEQSCIDKSIAEKLGLPVVDGQHLSTCWNTDAPRSTCSRKIADTLICPPCPVGIEHE